MTPRAITKKQASDSTSLLAVVLRAAQRVNLTATGLVAIVMMLGGWFAARLIGSRAMYLIVYAALLTMILSWVVTRRRLSLKVERSRLPRRIRVGQIVQAELEITAGRRVSTLLVADEIPSRLGAPVHVPIASLRSGQKLTHQYTLKPSLRGIYTVGPATASWSDPFGFTLHRQVLPEPTDIIVHPPVEVVRDRVLTRMWEDPPVRPPISKPWPVGFEFYGMRDYVPGDDLRRVVWPVLAKTGKMMVRESEQGITDRVAIVIDTNAEWHSPGEVSETFETAIRAVASLGVSHLRDGFSLSLTTNEGRIAAGLRGSRSEIQFLDQLAGLRRGSKPLSDAGMLLIEETKSNPHVLVVAPYLSPSDARNLRLITERGLSVVFAQVVWEESDLQSSVRAATVGAHVVQIESGVSLEALFEHRAAAGSRR